MVDAITDKMKHMYEESKEFASDKLNTVGHGSTLQPTTKNICMYCLAAHAACTIGHVR